jgi:polyhydroxybutyrate depolymerase
MRCSNQCSLAYIKLRVMIILGGIFIFLFFANKLSHAQTQTGRFKFEGHTRNYIVFLPQNFQPNMPVVISIPGYTETAKWYMDYTQMNTVADTAGFIPVYPNAIYPGFNSGIGENPEAPTPDVNDVGFIDALIDTLYNHFSIDLERVYACGYSNGGFMSYKLACQLSHRIAAIASVAGTISFSTADNCNAGHTMPVLHIHGTADSVVPLKGATGWNSVNHTLSQWIDFNGCTQVDTVSLADLDQIDGCTIEKISYTNCSNESKVIFYKVIKGGHAWPGSTIPPFHSAEGNRNMDINANVEIWNFFNNYKLVTSIETSSNSTPRKFCLMQNYPNPFNPSTTIQYQLPKNGMVILEVYNHIGQRVVTLVNQNQTAGIHQQFWDGRNDMGKIVPTGVYFYQLRSGDFSATRKMLLMQ